MDLKRAFLLTGKSELAPEPIMLHAGTLSVKYENGAIRSIKNGDVEVLRMIYAAVRDKNWGTVLPVIRDEQIDTQENSFQISYHAEYRHNDIAFDAQYTITGAADGRIHFAMHGVAQSDFLKNRIGFCVLHPIVECVGKDCKIIHPDGSQTIAAFPIQISPYQPFQNIASMHWQPHSEISADLYFFGDIFETEDQRNWIDASYKTYCTPLALPFPVKMKKGQLVEQQVELQFTGRSRAAQKSRADFEISRKKLPFPRIGIGASSLKTEVDKKSVALLKDLHLHHYRIDIDLTADNWIVDLRRELINAENLHIQIEAVLHIDPSDFTSYNLCVTELAGSNARIFCIVLLNADKNSTDAALLAHIVPQLRTVFPDLEIGGGTDCYFTELNRERTPTNLVDFMTFSINPEVHAFDNASLTETLQAHQYIVESAKAFAAGKAVHVSPVTFKMRFNPNATGEQQEYPADELPPQVDPRQMSLYGAAWTLGSIKYLAESQADVITYFETVGWRGIIQGDQDSPNMQKFPAEKGDVFPMYQIFKWIMEFKQGQVVPVRSAQPLIVDGFLLEHAGKRRLLIANYTLQLQQVHVPPGIYSCVVLEGFSARTLPAPLPRQNPDSDKLVLSACAVACIDYEFLGS